MDQTVILFAFTIVNGLIGVSTYLSTRKKEGHNDGQQVGIILTNLDNLKESINEVKADLKYLKNQDNNFVEQLTRVESSCEEAHKRIDKIEATVNKIYLKEAL